MAKRKMSKAGRERIAAAQRARWARSQVEKISNEVSQTYIDPVAPELLNELRTRNSHYAVVCNNNETVFHILAAAVKLLKYA